MSQVYVTPEQEVVSGNKASTGLLSFAKVFMYMFIGLAITTVVAFVIGGAFYYASIHGAVLEDLVMVGIAMTIVSAISLLILTLIINLITLKGKHSIVVPAILYCTFMGVVFSWFTIAVDWRILGMAFGITSGIFGLMSLRALFTKGNMRPLLMMGIGLFIGAGILVLVNWIIQSDTIMWVVSFALFAAIMFVTMFDIWNIKNICEKGAMSNNLALYCAFTLYVDFIYILIRVLYFLLIIFANKK